MLHLIAFVVYQTFKLNDTLIDTLLSAVQAAVNGAEKAEKEAYFQEREKRSQSLSALADNLRQSVRETISSIQHIVANAHLSDSQKVALIGAVVNTEKATASVDLQVVNQHANLTTLQRPILTRVKARIS